MDTLISIPDETFDRASRRAIDLGVSLSKFFIRAADQYLCERDANALTKQIDAALAGLGREDGSRNLAVGVGRRIRVEGGGDW